MGLPNIGPLELIIILAVLLLIVGPRRLPEMGQAVGRTIKEFRKASTEITDATAVTADSRTSAATTMATPAPTAAPLPSAPLPPSAPEPSSVAVEPPSVAAPDRAPEANAGVHAADDAVVGPHVTASDDPARQA